jgi:hypothetical protein
MIVFQRRPLLEDEVKKMALFVLMGFVFVLLAGCVVSHPRIAPPPLKKEVRSVKPDPNHVWISGHWKWSAGRYVWIPGHWTKAKPGKVWVKGHWKKKGPRYVWVPGHWK